MQKKSYNIGAAIITRDAQDTIRRVLKSIQGICRQIVVVDTGSVDNTPQICTREGTELYFHKWNNDFSEARNYALQFMRTEWILIIDSDEELNRESFFENVAMLENDDIAGITLTLENYLKPGNRDYKTHHRYTRIFRNRPEYIFEGKVHEQIRDSIERQNGKIVDSDIIIRHYGYDKTDAKKIERNRELLMQELEENPQDDWTRYHLAETEFTAGNIHTAAEIFESLMNSRELSEEKKSLARIRTAQAALSNEQFELSESMLDFAATDVHLEGLRKYVLAAGYLVQKQYRKAYDLYTSPELIESSLVDKSKLEETTALVNRLLNQ